MHMQIKYIVVFSETDVSKHTYVDMDKYLNNADGNDVRNKENDVNNDVYLDFKSKMNNRDQMKPNY